jgi:ribosome biogenesis GTPase
MRELGLWDAAEGVDETFADLIELAARCRFADCSHRLEPGCAIQAAVSGGRVDQGRVKSYRRLSHELAEQPTSVATRREKDRRFGRMVRNASAESTSRKAYRGDDY